MGEGEREDEEIGDGDYQNGKWVKEFDFEKLIFQ